MLRSEAETARVGRIRANHCLTEEIGAFVLCLALVGVRTRPSLIVEDLAVCKAVEAPPLVLLRRLAVLGCV